MITAASKYTWRAISGTNAGKSTIIVEYNQAVPVPSAIKVSMVADRAVSDW
jgi:hypothetical protein